MNEIRMTHSRPSGFSDVEPIEKPVTIIGFVSVGHSLVHAVFLSPGGYLDSAPLADFKPIAAGEK